MNAKTTWRSLIDELENADGYPLRASDPEAIAEALTELRDHGSIRGVYFASPCPGQNPDPECNGTGACGERILTGRAMTARQMPSVRFWEAA